MARTKYMAAAERLAKRIRNGDYQIGGLPPERDLATDLDVSHMTARKAIQQLVNDGLLSRLPNGRLEIQNGTDGGAPPAVRCRFALLAPAWSSAETDEWSIALAQLAPSLHFSFRVVFYAHVDDPAILNTVKSFDGTFLLAADLSTAEIRRLQETGAPFFAINTDWSPHGVPSLRLSPPGMVQRLLDHLAGLGHRRIDCLNVQPSTVSIPERIAQWKVWLAAHGLEGNLFDEPVRSYQDTMPAAYRLVRRLLQDGDLEGCHALLCMTEPAARGALRALVDHGIQPGKDLALCTADFDAHCEYTVPSLTSMEWQDPRPYLATCIRWVQGKSRKWTGPLLLQPADIKVVVRQSTVPDVDKTRPPARMRGG